MHQQFRVVSVIFGWTAFVTIMHLSLNTHVFEFNKKNGAAQEFKVGFLPVT